MRLPRKELLVSLSTLLVISLFAVALALLLSKAFEGARDDDELLERNRVLLERVQVLEEQGNANVAEHREFNQRDHDEHSREHAAICRLIESIAANRGIPAEKCPPPQVE